MNPEGGQEDTRSIEKRVVGSMENINQRVELQRAVGGQYIQGESFKGTPGPSSFDFEQADLGQADTETEKQVVRPSG